MNKKEFALTIIIGTVIGGVMVLGVQQFFKTYELQKPITLSIGVHIQPPISKRNIVSPVSSDKTISPLPQISPKLKTLSPTPTKIPSKKKQAMIELLHTDIYKKIQMLESSGGKKVGLNAYCNRLGKYNTVGYSPSTKHCFDSITDEMEKVGHWFDNKFKQGYTVAEAACMWNVGRRTEDCQYAKTLASL